MPKREKTSISNVFRYPSGRLYYVRGRVEKSLETNDLKLAESRKKDLESRLSFFGPMSYKRKVSEEWQKYLDMRYLQLMGKAPGGKKIRPRTFEEIDRVYKVYLKKPFENCRLIEVDEVRWNKFVKNARVPDLRNHRKVMLGFLNHCKQEGLIKILPDLKVPVVNRRVRKIVDPVDLEQLFKVSPNKLLLYNCMYLFMAMRNGEIVGMEWSRVFFNQGYIALRAIDVKTGKPRNIPLNPIVRVLLLKTRDLQLEAGIKSPYVFPKRGKPQEPTISTGLRKSWELAIKKCGWPVGYIQPHDLRATYEHYSNKRADFTDAQREKFAGASISVQKNIYVSFQPEDLKGLENVVQVPGIENLILSSWDGSGK